jgi:hypothetical protein
MHTLQFIFWAILGLIAFVIAPMAMVVSAIAHFREPASKRSGGGAMSNALGASLQELDRLVARPSVEYQLEAEQATLEDNDDSTGDPLRK